MWEENSSNLNAKTVWKQIKKVPEDPIIGMNLDYIKDAFPQKVNLSIGVYRDDQGKPYILNCVKKAIDKYIKDNIDHDYLPMGGYSEFCENAIKFAYKSDFKFLNRVAAIQSLSGTGALRIAQKFLSEFFPFKKKYFLHLLLGVIIMQ